MDKGISYLNRNFADYKAALQEFTKLYYPELAESVNDASLGSWLIDLNASVADNLSYYIDRAYQETCIDSAQEASSLNAIARSNGVKVPGAKASMAEVEISCILPVASSENQTSPSSPRVPNWAYAPIVKKGTKFQAGSQVFELMGDEDIDFSHQFNSEGRSDRTYIPQRDNNGQIVSYKVTKKAVVVAGESRVYKRQITSEDIVPFFNVTLPYDNILSVESIIFKDGDNFQDDPTYAEFMLKEEYTPANLTSTGKEVYRFFEVDNLAQQYRWGDVTDNQAKPVKYVYGYQSNGQTIPTFAITKGEWKPVRQKFITEYTDGNYLKVTFGGGYEVGQTDVDISKSSEFAKYLISRMVNNDAMGVVPKNGTTMFILYRVGGGAASNVGVGAINTISYYNVSIGECNPNLDDAMVAKVRNSLRVSNITPSVSGRDRLGIEELRNFIKYYKGAQDRCVTTNDYHARILEMPAKYGCAYRVGVLEENNKIMTYLLGLDNDGHLTSILADQYVKNLINYLSEYRMINDFVEMKSGRIINVSFAVGLQIDKAYNASDVIRTVIQIIKDYMDVDKHQMGDEIYVGDIKKEILQTDGVLNITEFHIFNEYDENQGYSPTQSTQEMVLADECTTKILNIFDDKGVQVRSEIDLDAEQHILKSEKDTMLEIKFPDKDIKIQATLR